MNEEMKEAEKLLVIENEMKKYNTLLNAATYKIIESGATKYPIYVVAKQPIALGIQLIDRTKSSSNWSINASSLEEFITNKLIFENKKEDFLKRYKDPLQFHCLFILSDLGAQFIFLPNLVKEKDS